NRIMVQYSTNTESKVIIQVHDLSGKYVKTLFQGKAGQGEHQIFWDKTGRFGKSISSGIYFISIKIGNKTERLKVAISK
ncbi:MAG: T9SS type A sorting domain-containing protein, partial [Candidatus Bathyarchaeota archaeon]|nr:T9SS type A sorting domain-containing protein [Candidatus Bathyarchaeota archaeon]